jgi:2-methylcitrate dehydratase PrpD
VTGGARLRPVGRTGGADAQADDHLVESQLAELASQAQWADLPAPARDYAQALTMDALANAIAGRSAETVAEFEMATSALAGSGRHAVCGGRPLSAWAAAGQNAYQMTVYTMCDVYRPALCHVTPEVVPAALAAAEVAGASGRDFLLAVALGYEVTTRVCLALDYPVFRGRGWHSPGVAGALGAAAAAGRLLGLDAGRMYGCLGLAGAQAAGTFAAMGTVAVKFHQANGARAGLAAALYAASGFAGSPQILSAADGGILNTYSGGGSPALAVAGLGESWELQVISMRSYPAASTLQALVDCLLSAEAQAAYQAGQVSTAAVWLPPHAYRLGNGGWGNQLAAMQSARFVTAVALRQGSCWLDSFSPQQRGDETITSFAAGRVDVRPDEGLAEGAVRVLLRGAAGDLELGRDYPHGDSRDPLTAAEVEAKAARCVAASLPAGRAGAAAAALAGLPTAPDITTFTRAVTG